LVELVISELVN